MGPAFNRPTAKILERIAAEVEIVASERVSRQGRLAKGKQVSIFVLESLAPARRASRVMPGRLREQTLLKQGLRLARGREYPRAGRKRQLAAQGRNDGRR